MKCSAFVAILSTLFASTTAAPALIWQRGADSSSVQHSSESVHASHIIRSSIESSPSLASVIFLVGRDEDGSEALSRLTSSGSLPKTASKYSDVHSVHYHVEGMESRHTVADQARRALSVTKNDEKVLEVTLAELSRRLASVKEEDGEAEVASDGTVVMSKAQKRRRRRLTAVDSARALIVQVDANVDVSALDSAVSAAIVNDNIGTVILAGIRSVDEVKRDRMLASQSKNSRVTYSNRRLDANADDQANEDAEGTYYVYATPNILAGILFFLFFTSISWIGINCMNMIEGQDVYVKKMPNIGREA